MSEVMLAGVLNRESEFVNGLTALCGPNALHTCATWAKGGYVSTWSVYQTMRAHSPALCDSNGASNIGGLNTAVGSLGLTVGRYEPYINDYFAAWRSFALSEINAGRAVLVEISRGQKLVNFLNGKGENATNLQYHFVAIVGFNTGGKSLRPEAAGKILPNGWWVADGDNYTVGDVLQFYPDSVFDSASPCCMLSVNHLNGAGQTTTYDGVSAPPSGSTSMGIPAGWHDDGTTLTAPNGKTVRYAFRYHIINGSPNWPANLMPLGDEYSRDGHDAQDFALTLEWVNNAVTENAPQDLYGKVTTLSTSLNQSEGQVTALTAELTDVKSQLATTQGQVTAANGQVSDLSTQLKTANDEIAALKAQLAALQNQPPVVPAPTPVPVDAAAALAYVKALKQSKSADAAAEQALTDALNAVN